MTSPTGRTKPNGPQEALRLWSRSGRVDSNHRPSDPQSDALTRLRYAPSHRTLSRTTAGTLVAEAEGRKGDLDGPAESASGPLSAARARPRGLDGRSTGRPEASPPRAGGVVPVGLARSTAGARVRRSWRPRATEGASSTSSGGIPRRRPGRPRRTRGSARTRAARIRLRRHRTPRCTLRGAPG